MNLIKLPNVYVLCVCVKKNRGSEIVQFYHFKLLSKRKCTQFGIKRQ